MNLTLMATLSASSLMCLLVNSWATIWILLEMNTMAFCSLLFIKFSGEVKKTKESMMKYFVIQSIASALLVMASLTTKSSLLMSKMMMVLTTTALMVKAASSPVHQWFLSLSKKTNWLTNSILFTWQKLAPVFLMIYQVKALILPFLVASAVTGATAMVNKSLTKEIMALSSVFNLSWMMLTICLNTKVFFTFLVMYWISLAFVLQVMTSKKSETMNKTLAMEPKKPTLMLMFMNLAGIPPLLGFLAKWLSFTLALTANMKITVTILLILSAINLFVYLRMTSPTNMKDSESQQKAPLHQSTAPITLFMMANSLAMAFMII